MNIRCKCKIEANTCRGISRHSAGGGEI